MGGQVSMRLVPLFSPLKKHPFIVFVAYFLNICNKKPILKQKLMIIYAVV